MRAFVPACLAVLSSFGLGACGDSSTAPGPALPEEPEVPRGSYELLVERFSVSDGLTHYTMAADGTRVAAFPGLPAGASSPIPSPDGTVIAFLQPTDESDLHLCTMSRDGADRRTVLGGTRLVEHVAWSPDGTRFAISGSTFEENADIWTLDTNGSGLENLTPDPLPGVWMDSSPTWSPDGQFIAFQSNRTGLSRLWVMRADGSDPRQVVVDEGTVESAPAWSPDGQTIAFVIPALGIGFVQPDGSGYRELAIAGDPQNLAWTPEGRVLFSARGNTDREVFVMDQAGGTPVNLTRHADDDLRVQPMIYVTPAAWRGFGTVNWSVSNRVDPEGIAAGDPTSDGNVDVFVLDPDFDSIRMLQSTANGVLDAVGTLDAEAPHRALRVADISGDRVDDLVVLGETSLRVWRGDVGGPLEPTTHELGGMARGLAVFDFDRDGAVDIAGIYEGAGQTFRMLVHGTRAFDGALIAILDYPSTFTAPGLACAADFTGDGAGDVVVVSEDPLAPLLLVPGQGDITFAATVVASTEVSGEMGAVPIAADFDGDRRADLVLIERGTPQRLLLLRSLGTSFDAPVDLGVAGHSVACSDVDRDGDVDLLVSVPDRAAVFFLRNRGNGEFARPVTIATGGRPTYLTVADLDHDAWPDLLMVDAGGWVGAMLNRRR